MINKGWLLSIPNLKLMGKIDKWDDKRLQKYIDKLNWFVDNLPSQEFKIKSAFAARDYDALSQGFTVVWDMLESIHAEDLAFECYRQIKILRNIKDENLEAYISSFLSVVSSLSIDIQLAGQQKSESPAPPAHPAHSAQSSAADDGPERRILAVDDVALFLNTLKMFLQDTRYRLTCVTSGNAALRFLQQGPPDLFILDIEMPEMDGYELAQKIKEQAPDVPVIFLTGNSNKENVIKAIRAGASDFIVKPINKELLLDKIAKFI